MENRVDNPLLYREPDQLLEDIRRFHERNRLEDVVDCGLLVRGAQLAQDAELFRETDRETGARVTLSDEL